MNTNDSQKQMKPQGFGRTIPGLLCFLGASFEFFQVPQDLTRDAAAKCRKSVNYPIVMVGHMGDYYSLRVGGTAGMYRGGARRIYVPC